MTKWSWQTKGTRTLNLSLLSKLKSLINKQRFTKLKCRLLCSNCSNILLFISLQLPSVCTAQRSNEHLYTTIVYRCTACTSHRRREKVISRPCTLKGLGVWNNWRLLWPLVCLLNWIKLTVPRAICLLDDDRLTCVGRVIVQRSWLAKRRDLKNDPVAMTTFH